MNNLLPEKIGDRLICLLIVVVCAGVFSLQKLYDYDVWWHLGNGRWIVEQGTFPAADFFSFSTPGAAWSYVYGLSDPWLYLLYRWTGSSGPQLFATLIITIAVAGLFLFLTARRLSPPLAALLAILVVQAARFRFMVRPLVFKFAGIVFLFWFFYREQKFRYRYPVFFLGVLLWNWLYPAAFLAQIFAAFLLVEKSVECFAGSSRYQPGALKDAAILLLLASLAILLHPEGPALYRMAYGGIFAEKVAFVEEQQGLVWGEQPFFAVLVLLAGSSFLLGRKQARLFTLLIFAAFVWLAWGSVRFAGISAFAMAGVIGANLGNLALPPWLPGRITGSRWLKGAVLAVLIGLCLVLWQMTFSKARGYEFGLGIKESRYPYAAMNLLKAAGFSGNIYNSWKFGGFLQWHLPAAKTFIDGRCLPAQLELYQRFQTIDLHDFSRYLTGNQVQAALLDRQDLRDVAYLTSMPGFHQVHADDISILFARDDLRLAPEGQPKGRYQYLRLGGYEFEYLAPLATGPEAPVVEEEIRRAISLAPDSFFENFLLAYYFETRKDPRAAAQYLLAARKNPAFAVTHFELGRIGGQAALNARQWDVAAEIATLALEYQKTGELYFILGAARHQMQQREAAEKAYRASLDLAENAQVRNNLGFLLLEMDRPDAARAAFAEKLEQRQDRDREHSLYGLALSLGKLQKTKEAAGIHAQLAREFPQSEYLRKLR